MRSPVRLYLQRRTGWGYAYLTLRVGRYYWEWNVPWLAK